MVKHDSYLRQLKLNIAYYRKMRGYTQEKLSEMVNVSRSHMSSIEAINVKKYPSYDLLFDIADALDIPVAKLFEFE